MHWLRSILHYDFSSVVIPNILAIMVMKKYSAFFFYSPESVCSEEWDVERLFFWVMLKRHQHSIAEPYVCQQLEAHQPISGRTVISIQHFTWIKELYTQTSSDFVNGKLSYKLKYSSKGTFKQKKVRCKLLHTLTVSCQN